MATKEEIIAQKSIAVERYILSTMPVLYLPLWKLDGSSFTSADGHGHTCTVTGATWTSQGRSFDDTDDEIALSNVASLKTASDLTVTAWVYFTGTAGNEPHIYHNGSGETTGTLIRVGGTNTMRFLHNTGAGYYLVGLGNNSITSSVWTHVALTYNSGTTTLTALLDTVSKGTDATATATAAARVQPKIGGPSSAEAARHWGGLIGEVQIYNRALSVGEVSDLYNKTKFHYT